MIRAVAWVLYPLLAVLLFVVPPDWIAPVRVTLACAAAVAATVFIADYHRLTRGRWSRSVHGVHLVAFSGLVAASFTLSTLTLLDATPPHLRPYLGAWISLTAAACMVWRWLLMRRDIRDAKRKDDDDGA